MMTDTERLILENQGGKAMCLQQTKTRASVTAEEILSWIEDRLMPDRSGGGNLVMARAIIEQAISEITSKKLPSLNADQQSRQR